MTNAHKGVVSRRGPQPTGSYPHAHVHGKMVWVTAQAGRDQVLHGFGIVAGFGR